MLKPLQLVLFMKLNLNGQVLINWVMYWILFFFFFCMLRLLGSSNVPSQKKKKKKIIKIIIINKKNKKKEEEEEEEEEEGNSNVKWNCNSIFDKLNFIVLWFEIYFLFFIL